MLVSIRQSRCIFTPDVIDFMLPVTVLLHTSLCLSLSLSVFLLYYYVADKATYIRLLHGKIGFLGFFRP